MASISARMALEVDGGGALIGSLAAHIVELERQGSNVVDQQLRERRRSAHASGGGRCIRTAVDGFRTGVGLAQIGLC